MGFHSMLLDIFFPKHCVSCGEFGEFVCNACISKIKVIDTQICPLCERSSIGGKTHPGCQNRYTIDGVISCFVYEGEVKDIIHNLKYPPYVTGLVTTIETLIQDRFLHENMPLVDFVVPVPLHPQRERERGFNQASLLGRTIAKRLGVGFRDRMVKRTRYTTPQVQLSEQERRDNIKDAFAIAPKSNLIGRNIFLVDDVWTTGSTLRACGNILKRSGATNVYALTFAR